MFWGYAYKTNMYMNYVYPLLGGVKQGVTYKSILNIIILDLFHLRVLSALTDKRYRIM